MCFGINKSLANNIYSSNSIFNNMGYITKLFSIISWRIHYISRYIFTKPTKVITYIRSYRNNTSALLSSSCAKLKVKPGSTVAKDSNIYWILNKISSSFIDLMKVSLYSDIVNDMISITKSNYGHKYNKNKVLSIK